VWHASNKERAAVQSAFSGQYARQSDLENLKETAAKTNHFTLKQTSFSLLIQLSATKRDSQNEQFLNEAEKNSKD